MHFSEELTHVVFAGHVCPERPYLSGIRVAILG
jgi:hypothetical protein